LLLCREVIGEEGRTAEEDCGAEGVAGHADVDAREAGGAGDESAWEGGEGFRGGEAAEWGTVVRLVEFEIGRGVEGEGDDVRGCEGAKGVVAQRLRVK
jgi:hypothetical protein